MTPAAPPNPVFPPGRYGRRRDPAAQRRRRWVTVALAALVVAGGIAIAVKLYRQYSAPLYEVTNIQSSDLGDHAVTVTWDVRTPPGAGATCTVRAHTRDGELVGEATVIVPPGGPDQTTVRMTYTLATAKRPMTGEVPGCGP